MPRKPRPHVPGAVHHLISRFVNREWRLRDRRDRAFYMRGLERSAGCADARQIAYALMSNHVHLASEGGEVPIGHFVHRLNTGFARTWNERHDALGPVFAGRPKSILVSAEERLAVLIAYIHNNPVRAQVVQNPADSTWTSHRAYVGLAPAAPWLNVEWALAKMGFSSSPSGRASFHDFVCSRSHLARDPTVAGSGPLPANFGEALLAAVAEEVNRTPEQIRKPRSDLIATRARRLAITLATDSFHLQGAEIARRLGLAPATVSNVLSVARGTAVADAVKLRLVERVLERAQGQG